MVNMTKDSAMRGLLEPIRNSAILKSVLQEAVLREAYVYLILASNKLSPLSSLKKSTVVSTICKNSLYGLH